MYVLPWLSISLFPSQSTFSFSFSFSSAAMVLLILRSGCTDYTLQCLDGLPTAISPSEALGPSQYCRFGQLFPSWGVTLGINARIKQKTTEVNKSTDKARVSGYRTIGYYEVDSYSRQPKYEGTTPSSVVIVNSHQLPVLDTQFRN